MRLVWAFVLGLCLCVEARMITPGQCDWTGSGLTSPSERAVTPVYLGCREGTVSWLYPRGALRLIFEPPMPGDAKDFKVCIRVMRRPDPPDLFHSLVINDTKVIERFPARMFVEGVHRLVALYAPDDGDTREMRCFYSKRGRAAVYVEADPEEGPKRRVATFKYEARPQVRRHYDPATADCRPCTESELELAFCTSDLVSRGMFVGSEQRQDLDTTQLTLKMTKLIRALGDVGGGGAGIADQYYGYELDNSIEPVTHRNHRRRKGRSLHAHIHMPSVCGASAGSGEFLVMARRRLGKYSLVCAPRVEDWVKIVKKRNKREDVRCLLQH